MKRGLVAFVLFGGIEGYFYYLNRAGDLEMFFMLWAVFALFGFLSPLITGSYLGGTALGINDTVRQVHEAEAAAEAMVGGRRGNQKPQLKLSSAVMFGFFFVLNVICYIVTIL
jgi:hypothetical protein